ncbi:dead end protein homolog 1-like isoform X1 [Petromyzon marinus]|uniref:dead end protein homolog 1-like isoform X1 n=2 Tax=Petromyzon marinus TaxID=7757 RepID=UPI003F730240
MVWAERVPAGDLALQELIPPVALSSRGDRAECQGLRRCPSTTVVAKPPVLGMACMKVLLDLMLSTGYNIVQENGQRKFGPPPDWQGPPPARGCEVFLVRIPRDLYEDELVPVLETVGKLYQLRLMMEHSGETRGYAFATYVTLAQATDAVKKLDKFEIRPGRRIGVCFSVDNRRLFIGGLPEDKKRAEVMMAMSGATEGVVDVKMSVCRRDKTLNRGYAFIEYGSHRAAAMARKKLLRINFRPWGRTIKVGWAIPEWDTVAAAAATEDEEMEAAVPDLRQPECTGTGKAAHSLFEGWGARTCLWWVPRHLRPMPVALEAVPEAAVLSWAGRLRMLCRTAGISYPIFELHAYSGPGMPAGLLYKVSILGKGEGAGIFPAFLSSSDEGAREVACQLAYNILSNANPPPPATPSRGTFEQVTREGVARGVARPRLWPRPLVEPWSRLHERAWPEAWLGPASGHALSWNLGAGYTRGRGQRRG